MAVAEEGTVFHHKSVLWCIELDWPHSIVFYRWFEAEVIAGLVLDCGEMFALSLHLARFYRIIDPQHAKMYSEENLSPGYILKIFLKCRKFQPQCFSKGDCCKKCSLKCHSSSCHFFAGLGEKTDDISDEWLVCLSVYMCRYLFCV